MGMQEQQIGKEELARHAWGRTHVPPSQNHFCVFRQAVDFRDLAQHGNLAKTGLEGSRSWALHT